MQNNNLPRVINISGAFTSYGFSGTVELYDDETGRRWFSTGEHGKGEYNWAEYAEHLEEDESEFMPESFEALAARHGMPRSVNLHKS